MKQNNFEKALPEGYRVIKHINAKSAKFGIIMNLIAIGVLFVIMAICAIPVIIKGEFLVTEITKTFWVPYIIFMLSMVVYIVLHEIVHGIAYKAMTGEKLTFGLSWSCAFCGVPNIYTYRKTALISVAAPLVVFTVILLPATIALFYIDTVFYFVSAFLLGLHIGGCGGDIYCIYLLMKNRDKRLLMKDTGPEQTFYLPENNK